LPLALHGLVHEARRQPDRRRAETLDVVEVRAQTGDVAALVEAGGGRVEPGREAVAAEPARVVRRVAVGEAVGHDEVELLAVAGLSDRVRDEGGIVVRIPAAEGEDLVADAVLYVVEEEPERRGTRDRERDVVAAAVEAVRLVPAVVHRDLVLPR